MVQVIAATNRIDILDPALLRSGRLDRKIEFPLPDEKARAKILEIHSRKMSVEADVNYAELARSTDEFNGAQLKATCVEAGMIALREGATKLNHEHYLSGIAEGMFLVNLFHSFRALTRFPYSSSQEEERSHVFRLIGSDSTLAVSYINLTSSSARATCGQPLSGLRVVTRDDSTTHLTRIQLEPAGYLSSGILGPSSAQRL
jgi:SpoVK/Ycf46/Vps4 family AAA+-type ATPase